MSANRKSLTITSSDVTRRELLATAAVTGGALVGGQVMPGGIPPARIERQPVLDSVDAQRDLERRRRRSAKRTCSRAKVTSEFGPNSDIGQAL